MSSKNKIAVLIFIVAATLSLWLYLRRGEGTIRKELYDFAIQDTGSISKIYMASMGGKQVLLEKKGAGHWQVNGKYKARNDAVRNLLICAKDLRVQNTVSKSALENISKQLATSATKVELYSGEKLVKVYYVGNDTQDGLGTYMLLVDPETGENSTMPFVMFIPGFNGFLSIRYFLDEDSWRDRSVFSFYPNEISSINVHYTHLPDSGFTISLSDKNEISLMDAKGRNIPRFDTLKAKRYITYYTNIQYESMQVNLRPTYRDSVLAKGPVHIITLKDRKGKSHRIRTFSRPADPDKLNPATEKPYTEDPERLFAIMDDEKDIISIQYYVFGKLFVSGFWFTIPSSLSEAVGVKK